MCWKTYIDENAEIRTAERDIPVFKVAYGSAGQAPEAVPVYAVMHPGKFYRAGPGLMPADTYEPGREYRPSGFDRPEWLERGGYYFAERGFHSYSAGCSFARTAETLRIYAPDGLPLDTVRDRPDRGDTLVMECVIPKGASYCVNEYGECVSDRIRTVRFRRAAKQ